MRTGSTIIREVTEKYPVLKKDKFKEFNERDYRV